MQRTKRKEFICENPSCGKSFLELPSHRRGKHIYCCNLCRSQHLKILLKGKNNPNYRKGNCCNNSFCECGNIKDFRSSKCSSCSHRGYPKNIKEYRPYNQVIETIKTSTTILESAQKLGVKRDWITRFIKKNNIDISHFDPCKHRPLTLESITKKKKYFMGAITKKLLYKNGIKNEICEICGQGNIWNGQKLVLQLHHINGDRTDNKIENLQILCPNCHTQTPNYQGKKRKPK